MFKCYICWTALFCICCLQWPPNKLSSLTSLRHVWSWFCQVKSESNIAVWIPLKLQSNCWSAWLSSLGLYLAWLQQATEAALLSSALWLLVVLGSRACGSLCRLLEHLSNMVCREWKRKAEVAVFMASVRRFPFLLKARHWVHHSTPNKGKLYSTSWEELS